MSTINQLKLQRSVGARIREIRESLNMEQQQLAARIDIEKSSMSRIESGKTNPTLWTLAKIANALEVEIYELLYFEYFKRT